MQGSSPDVWVFLFLNMWLTFHWFHFPEPLLELDSHWLRTTQCVCVCNDTHMMFNCTFCIKAAAAAHNDCDRVSISRFCSGLCLEEAFNQTLLKQLNGPLCMCVCVCVCVCDRLLSVLMLANEINCNDRQHTHTHWQGVDDIIAQSERVQTKLRPQRDVFAFV